MGLIVPAHLQKMVEDRVASGKYSTPADVLAAAMHALDQDEQAGDFAAGEWDTLLAEGEAGGDALDGQAVLTELGSLRPGETDRA
jgi:Arc/MetJ-type ribon-helix-helix transcriptional regulator